MKKIAIIGGGISGLYFANILNSEKNFEYKIFEKKNNFNFQDGYGIQLSVNSIKLLNNIGFKNHIGKRINIKMSNMDMRIAITMKNNLPLNGNGFFVDVKDLSNLTLPSFTKKILNTIR